MDLADIGVRHACWSSTDPRRARAPAVQTVARIARCSRHSLRRLRSGARRADRRIVSRRDRLRQRRRRTTPSSPWAADRRIDTAKAVNLYTSCPPADFLDYVNPPIGKGLPVPGPLKPLMAIPTTAGTGSETTGVAIFDLERLHAKTGIANRRLKPTLGYLDPDNTRTMPPEVAASSGSRHPEPRRRVLHGAAVHRAAAARIVRRCGRRIRARTRSATSGRCRRCGWSRGFSSARSTIHQTMRRGRNMLLAASYAGVGFGNAGVHLPHGMSYPVSGHVQELPRAGLRRRSSARAARHVGDPERAGGVPVHGVGQSGASSAGRGGARRRRVARARAEDAGRILADRITWFMQRLKMPNGLRGDRLLVVRHSRRWSKARCRSIA